MGYAGRVRGGLFVYAKVVLQRRSGAGGAGRGTALSQH